jgi:peptide/nickel transport system substrate-binding protein
MAMSRRVGGGMRRYREVLSRLASVLAAISVLSLGAIVIAAPSSGAAASKTSVTVPVGTWGPTDAVNYIFPFMTIAYFSVTNIDDFQYYMYRPLYLFGASGSVTVNKRLSVGDTPVFSNGDKTVKISLKTYKWSNGTKVSATGVLFWLNIWHQKPTGYAGWFPGGLSLPTSLKSVTVTSPSTITLTLKTPVNPHWFLYNELSEITPFPLAWTKTTVTAAAGSAGCAKASYGTDDTACKAVYDFLSEQSGYNPTNPKETLNALPTYATNPLWQVVDGPWKLMSFAPTEPFTLVPNPAYSGPNKPKIKEYIEKTFTTASAEYNAMVGGTIDAGLLPPTEITGPAAKPGAPGVLPKTGPNNPRLAATYDMVPAPTWSIDYYPYNFNSTGDTGNAGPIFKQLYFRQAYQHLIDQTLIVQRLDRGYGAPNYGPVPVEPDNTLISSAEKSNPYPYSATAATALLKAHGWKVVPNGVSTCQKPGSAAGDCGADIKKGAKLAFTVVDPAGTKTETAVMVAQKDSLSQAGIKITLSSQAVDTIFGDVVPCPKGCSWEIDSWSEGLAWLYSPDLYPNGTEILLAGAGSNDGSFKTATSTALIKKSITGNTKITKVENYLEKAVPVVWQPVKVDLHEYHKGLEGMTPTDPLTTLTPATFHWGS